MFDHLEPAPTRKVSWHHHISLGVLMLSCLTLAAAFSAPLVSFTKDERPTEETTVQLWLDASNTKSRQAVGPVDNLEVVHFVVKTDNPVTLERLRLTLDGLYQPVDLSSLRLYVDEVQIGRDRPVNGDGVATFEAKTVELSAGSHDIIVRTNWLVNRPGQLLKASIANEEDDAFASVGGSRKTEAVFPLTTAGISFVEAGSWLMVQPTDLTAQTADGDHNLQQVTFTVLLAVQAEPITVNRIVWGLETRKFIPNSLSLVRDDVVVKVWNNISQAKDLYAWEAPTSGLMVAPAKLEELKVIIKGIA